MEVKSEDQSNQRKRGRPAGKNRVPLSQEERRARNAQYEKERREEHARAAAMLAEAAGYEPNIPLMILLERVTSFLEKEAQRDPSDDVEALRSLNEKLMLQISTLEERLQLEHTSELASYYREEVPVRTNSNEVLKKKIKLERSSPSAFPTPSPEPLPQTDTRLITSLTLDSVLDDVISLEEETQRVYNIKLQEVPDSQWSTSSVLDDVISLEEETKLNVKQEVPDDHCWSASDFSLELLNN